MIDNYYELYDIILDTLRKLLYPEEWIAVDLSLSKTELLTLLQVSRNGEIIMSRIADYIDIPMSTATGMVERLVKKGYIERARSESDRRIVTIRLTDAGRTLAEDLKSRIMNILKLLTEDLTDEEEKLLYKIFIKAINLFSQKNDMESNDTWREIKKIKIE